jgi:hypothetical protein
MHSLEDRSVTETTLVVTITGTIDNYSNAAGCDVTFKAEADPKVGKAQRTAVISPDCGGLRKPCGSKNTLGRQNSSMTASA